MPPTPAAGAREPVATGSGPPKGRNVPLGARWPRPPRRRGAAEAKIVAHRAVVAEAAGQDQVTERRRRGARQLERRSEDAEPDVDLSSVVDALDADGKAGIELVKVGQVGCHSGRLGDLRETAPLELGNDL